MAEAEDSHSGGCSCCCTPTVAPIEIWYHNRRTLGTLASGVTLGGALIADAVAVSGLVVQILYALAMLLGGYHVGKSGLIGLRSLNLDTNFLMLVAAVGAVAIGEWSEGATVVFLFSLGHALQAYTMDRTRRSIRALMELVPLEALVQRGDEELRLLVEDIVVGDIMIVKPGEKIAMDGIVRTGYSTVNQAAITGESMPVEKQPDDPVYAGTINDYGALMVQVSKLAQDSTLSKILHAVEEAQTKKAPIQQSIDVFAKYYTPAVIMGALGLTIIPVAIFGQPFSEWFYRSLVLLVISCPCALVISTPVSIVSAIGNASRHGVLIKGGAYLEQMGSIRAMALDKTGTLTYGQPAVTDIIPGPGLTEISLIRMAAAVEKWSEHPLAKAIVARVGESALPETTNFQALVGRGAQAEWDNQLVYVGNIRLFTELGYSLECWESPLAQLQQQGKTVILVGSRHEVAGLIALADTARMESYQALADLRAVGIEHIAILTGDNKQVAQAMATQVGADCFYGELLPHDKLATLKTMEIEFDKVAMVGDGVNDAPALAAATVGIAMGVAGSDAALETADIALMNDDLGKLVYVMMLSRKTVAIIKQNIIFSLAVKVVFVAGTFLGFTNLWLAVFADTGASLLVTLNGLRLMREISK